MAILRPACISLALLILSNPISYYLGINKGQKTAYDDMISERCWLNKQSRDIECINYIAE